MAKKTSAKKKGAGKKALGKPSPAAIRKANRVRLEVLVKGMNKKLGGKGSILIGKQIEELEFRKELCGNPAFDYVTNGGIIRGRITQLWGPEAASKTTSMAAMIRHYQSQGMTCGVAPVEGFDKSWWRQIGAFIPYADREMDVMSSAQRRKAEAYTQFYHDAGYSPLVLIQHRAGDEVLQMIYELTKSGTMDFIGLDSLGAITNSRILDDRDITEEDERGGEARLFNRFQRWMQSAFNTSYDDEGNPSTDGTNFNQTMVCAINQARVTFGKANRREKQFHATGGQGLKHFWSQSIFCDRVGGLDGELADQVNYDGYQRRDVYAKTFRVFADKMRGGPPEREARFTLHVKNHTHDGQTWRAGQIDTVGTVRALGVMLGVIGQTSAWYDYGDHRINGKAKFDRMLWNEPEVLDELYKAVMQAAIDQSAAGSVPEVG